MSSIVGADFDSDVAAAVRGAREQRGWSGAQLAAAAGVSRAMIDRVERGVSSPTASLLGKLSGALGLTVSALLSRSTRSGERLVRDSQRKTWVDPETGYRRRQVIATPTFPVDVTDVTLPAGTVVAYPAASYAFTRHVIWVLDGVLTFEAGDKTHHLRAGDRLLVDDALDCEYRNGSDADCRYCVMVAPR